MSTMPAASLASPSKRRSRIRTTREVGRLFVRNAFIPINAIIFAVVVLLVVFGETREGLYLGAIVLLNIFLGFVQDLRAWVLLERLQIETALKVIRIDAGGTESQVDPEEITKGDRIRLALGDQAPCDGVLVESANLEVSEGLITGESNSFPRGEGASVLAGSVVTAGSGVMRAETDFAQSRLAKMAHGLARYSANPSPIQRSVEVVIRYTIYVLLAVTAFIVLRGVLTHEAQAKIVEQIGALASILVPQGLVVAVTLLLTYGAGHFYNRHVLLQEVNATEKFGRIKNLCMDKTGTLTENELTAESFLAAPGVDEHEARELASLYVQHAGDSSQVMRAVSAFLEPASERQVHETLPFSSWRRYGGLALDDSRGEKVVLVMGGPEALAPAARAGTERAWLEARASEAAAAGKHVLAVARAAGTTVPRSLGEADLSIIGLFILGNRLREGVRGAVDFFQSRGVTIRILSGDHPDTVRAVATATGIAHADALITGAEMKGWDASDYAHNVGKYALFTRIEPEQKERIVEALKQDGFTAMIGDGANDALSVKKADLGIALFDGAAATRAVAAVVLMHNSFVELPAGVRLADSMIENIEIFAAIFLNQIFVQLFFFLLLSAAGIPFPLTPLNVNFMNFFTVGLSTTLISAWAILPSPRQAPARMESFLKRVLPLPLALSVVQAVALTAIFFVRQKLLLTDSVAALLIISIVATGFAFLAVAAERISGGLSAKRRFGLYLFGIIDALFLFVAFKIPIVLRFFDLAAPSRAGTIIALATSAACALLLLPVAQLVAKGGTAVRTTR